MQPLAEVELKVVDGGRMNLGVIHPPPPEPGGGGGDNYLWIHYTLIISGPGACPGPGCHPA